MKTKKTTLTPDKQELFCSYTAQVTAKGAGQAQAETEMKRTSVSRGAISADDMFTRLVRSELHVQCVREYRFHDKRKWRFDYALPEYKIAVEIDGGVWTLGRHNRPRGYIADMEKFNEAAALGWLVLKFTPQQQCDIKTLALLQRTVKQRIDEENAAKGGFSTQNDVFLDKK